MRNSERTGNLLLEMPRGQQQCTHWLGDYSRILQAKPNLLPSHACSAHLGLPSKNHQFMSFDNLRGSKARFS